MAKTVTVDELHLTLSIPGDAPEGAAEVIRRALAGDGFLTRLRRAVRGVLRAVPELNDVRVSLTR